MGKYLMIPVALSLHEEVARKYARGWQVTASMTSEETGESTNILIDLPEGVNAITDVYFSTDIGGSLELVAFENETEVESIVLFAFPSDMSGWVYCPFNTPKTYKSGGNVKVSLRIKPARYSCWVVIVSGFNAG